MLWRQYGIRKVILAVGKCIWALARQLQIVGRSPKGRKAWGGQETLNIKTTNKTHTIMTRYSQDWLPNVFGNFFDDNYMPRVNATAPSFNVAEDD